MSSLVITVPISQLEAANSALESKGYGPNNLSIPMRGPTAVEHVEQSTHYGCHWFTGPEADAIRAIVSEAAPDAEFHDDSEGKFGFDLFDAQAGEYFYIPVNPDLIHGLTIGLGKLTGSEHPYARVIEHRERWPVLEIRERDIVPISIKGDPSQLVEVLTAFVLDGAITQEELSGIVGGVQAAAGHAVQLRDFIPPSWQSEILTREQAIAQGYFSQE